jgi:hypothetical protein
VAVQTIKRTLFQPLSRDLSKKKRRDVIHAFRVRVAAINRLWHAAAEQFSADVTNQFAFVLDRFKSATLPNPQVLYGRPPSRPGKPLPDLLRVAAVMRPDSALLEGLLNPTAYKWDYLWAVVPEGERVRMKDAINYMDRIVELAAQQFITNWRTMTVNKKLLRQRIKLFIKVRSHHMYTTHHARTRSLYTLQRFSLQLYALYN